MDFLVCETGQKEFLVKHACWVYDKGKYRREDLLPVKAYHNYYLREEVEVPGRLNVKVNLKPKRPPGIKEVQEIVT
jgi:hypothetical protein